MKRIAALFAALPLLLSGCSQSRGIYSNYLPVEELQLVRTLGVDAADAGLVLSAAAARPQGGAPTLLRAGAGSIPQGIDALQSRTPRGRLYFAHAQAIVLGERCAVDGVGDVLDYVERDVHTRMGAALYVVRGGTAEALITGSGEGWDVSDVLDTVKTETDARGDSHVFDVRETAVALSEYGAALICALRIVDTEGSVFALPSGLAAVPDGYGILRNGVLVGFLDGAQAQAASLMLGKLGVIPRVIPDGAGGTLTVELRCGAPEIDLLRTADGGIGTLRIRVAPTAVIAAPGRGAGAPSTETVAAGIDEALAAELAAVLARERAENADFLALSRALRTQGVDPADLPADWLQATDLQISVETVVRHGYDLDARAGTDGGGAA